MMPWTYQYIGIPFVPDGRSHNGCDCWGLVHLVYSGELGIELNYHNGVLANTDDGILTQRIIRKIIDDESKKWIQVDIPKEFDVILMSGRPYHVGVVSGKNEMIHVDEGLSACIEKYTSIMHKNKILRFYRYVV